MKIFNFEIRKIRDKTPLHPDYRKRIDCAFTIGDTDFYELKEIGDMPTERYSKCMQHLEEMNMRLDSQTLTQYIDEIQKELNQGNLTQIAVYINALKKQTEMLFETETFYRLASCIFFTLDEDLTDYDYDYGDWKIEKFKSEGIDNFFLHEPVKKLIPQIDSLHGDLQSWEAESKARIRWLKSMISS